MIETEDIVGAGVKITVSKDELVQVRERMNVLSTRLIAGQPVVHVLADASPGDGFAAVPPNLEDVYFGELRRAAAPVAQAA